MRLSACSLLIALVTVAALSAQNTPGVDLGGLSAAQKQVALKMLQESACPCQCGMKVAECRVKDPNCGYSKPVAELIVKAAKEGKSAEEIAKLAASAPSLNRPAPRPLLEAAIKIPTQGAPVKGPADAKITLVEFSDFECPYCSKAVGQIETLMGAYGKDVKLIYKQFPLSMHPHAEMAAAASLAAADQGKFWPMHDVLFRNYHNLSPENFMKFARDLGLDTNKFQADLASGKYKAVIAKDVADGDAAGVNGTPALFINGKHYNGPIEMEVLKPILDAELKTAK
jgi:protein-disulfide isomerase